MHYWGQEDTSVHFCEKKYDQVWWAAELFNTISSAFYIIVGGVLSRFPLRSTRKSSHRGRYRILDSPYDITILWSMDR